MYLNVIVFYLSKPFFNIVGDSFEFHQPSISE